jgi:CheY-like chemotaxis protein
MLPASVEMVADEAPACPLWVNADDTQLQQVVLNLAINARDAMPAGGKLRIQALPVAPLDRPGRAHLQPSPAGWACLLVSDTGTGMTSEVQARIFEPFFSTKPRGQGTGLGLSIIHGIVSEHGGQIVVESAPGKGSTFRIFLPRIAMVHQQEDINPPALTVAAGGGLVLLAEDHQFIREMLTATLRSLGYEVVPAHDGLAFLESYNRHRSRVRILILDVDLPKHGGLGCLRHIRAEGSQVPAILITGDVEEDLEYCLDNRSILLRKPFRMTHLTSLICEIMTTPPVNSLAEAEMVTP